MRATHPSPARSSTFLSLRPDARARVVESPHAQFATAGRTLWTPPWYGADALPANALTGRRYRGFNTLVLWAATQAQG
ncbi:MAG: ArdC family protein [Hyphomicrobiales bacterium]